MLNLAYREINHDDINLKKIVSSVKKKWLVSYVVLMLFNQITFLFMLLFCSTLDKNLFLFSIIKESAWGLITYYCAYRKQGTRWLMWILIIIPLSLVNELKNLLTPEVIVDLTEKTVAFSVMTFSIYGWFWMNCLRLRGANMSLKKRQPVESLN